MLVVMIITVIQRGKLVDKDQIVDKKTKELINRYSYKYSGLVEFCFLPVIT